MARELFDMEITEISLVDEPANDDARVVIVKSKSKEPGVKEISMSEIAKSLQGALAELSPQIVEKAIAEGFSANANAAAIAEAILKETVMDLEKLSKALEEAEAKIEEVEKKAADLEALVAEKDDLLKSKDAEIAKAKGGTGDSDEDAFIKSLPESVRKRIEKSEADAKAASDLVEKMRSEREEQEAIAKARTLGVGDATKVGPLLVRIAKGKTTEADATEIETLLKQASAIQSKSPLFKSLGSSVAVDGDPEALLKAKAEEIQKANSGMSYAAAYDRALNENPQLYSDYVAKRRATAPAVQ